MASKSKEVKPISIPAAVIIIICTLAAIATFVTYLVNPNLFSSGNDVSYNNDVVGQSFTEETVDEPPVIIGEEKDYFADADINDLVKFGSYKGTPIQWQIIAVEDGKVLAVSRYCLDVKAFNNSETSVSWESSSLRKWLAEDFYANAFSAEEAEVILDTQSSETVTDKVFILSAEEANEYFEYDSWRKAAPSESISASVKTEDGGCYWWLRNDGEASDKAPYVFSDGRIFNIGYAVDYDQVTVRPAIWVQVDNDSDVSDTSEIPDISADESTSETSNNVSQ